MSARAQRRPVVGHLVLGVAEHREGPLVAPCLDHERADRDALVAVEGELALDLRLRVPLVRARPQPAAPTRASPLDGPSVRGRRRAPRSACLRRRRTRARRAPRSGCGTSTSVSTITRSGSVAPMSNQVWPVVRDVKSPPARPHDMREWHREVGAASDVLAGVLVEDAVVDHVPALIEPSQSARRSPRRALRARARARAGRRERARRRKDTRS